MIPSNSKKTNFSSKSIKESVEQLNLELLITLFIGGMFLALFLLSGEVLLEELSKAILIITLLSLFRFIKPNSNNL
ncbi:hypothetical protein [Salegentibacter sp. HM20]